MSLSTLISEQNSAAAGRPGVPKTRKSPTSTTELLSDRSVTSRRGEVTTNTEVVVRDQTRIRLSAKVMRSHLLCMSDIFLSDGLVQSCVEVAEVRLEAKFHPQR